MIRARALEQFADRFAASGFDQRAFVPSYGLAEATLAVTFAELGQGLRVDWVDCGPAFERGRKALAVVPKSGAGAARTRPFAICGRPMPGYAIEIRNDAGDALPERTVGRVCLQGPSLMTGYFRDLQATRTVTTADGWLDTGDMGYLVDGELVITGRSKDLIIFNGRNIWPQDLEWAVEKLDGVRPGEVAAFDVTGDDDRERVVAGGRMPDRRSGEPAGAASCGQGDRAEGREHRVRGRAGGAGLADLHDLGQAQPCGGQGELPRWQHHGRRGGARRAGRRRAMAVYAVAS